MVKAFNISTQGASHIKKGKECQDRSFSYVLDGRGVAVVCDGHGGDDYVRSAVGADIGRGSANYLINKFLVHTNRDKFLSSPDEQLKQLESDIVNLWRKNVERHVAEHPFTEEELAVVSDKARAKYLSGDVFSAYGTTMLAVGIGIGIGYWFGIHIGDGRCVAVNPEGKFLQPIPWDKRCFLNATTSICDTDAAESFRHFFSEKLPVAVFIGSDGIDDSFANREQFYALYKTVLYSFATEEFNEARKSLENYLPRLSEKGSGDDVSIAALLDMEAIKALDVVKNFDVEKERAKVAATQQLEVAAEEKAVADETATEKGALTEAKIEETRESAYAQAKDVAAIPDSKEEPLAPVSRNEVTGKNTDCGEPLQGRTV